MRKSLIISILIAFSSCNKNDGAIINLNNNRIDVLGHAGMGISSLYPINSMESLLSCINSGANGTELDIQLSKDNILVAFHDENLDEKTNLSGRIRELTWDELSSGIYTSTQYLNYKVIRVSDIFNHLNNYQNYIFTFDIKLFPKQGEDFNLYLEDYTDAVSLLYSNYQLHNSTFVEAQAEDFLIMMKLKDGLIKQFIYPQVFETGYSIAQNLNLYGITISNENISSDQVKTAHDSGYFITIWGVNSNKENKNAVSKNPDMIQTDKLNHLISYLE